MNRRVFLRWCAGGVMGVGFSASVALAESFESSVVSQLRGQGYRDINIERTMLGRVRIVAERRGASREIILNPRTGEILRDVVLAENGQVEPQISGDDSSGRGSSGNDGSDDGSDDGSGDGSGDDGSDDGGSGDNGSDDGGDSGGSGSSGHGYGGDGDSGDDHDDGGGSGRGKD